MNSEIENLINMALADGEVTEKEREIILRKAESLGLDKDEVEMILEGKIALIKKDLANKQSKTTKAGDIKKCPSCGAPVETFTTKCSDCGHEFQNTESSNSVKQFFLKFNEIALEERERVKGLKAHWSSPGVIEVQAKNAITDRQISLISSFPIPNTKEDILEFLIIALPEATIKVSFFGNADYFGQKKLKQAWLNKAEQIILKAKFSMKDDKITLSEIDYYAKQFGIK